MKTGTKDKAKGKLHEMRGKLKAKVGAVTKNRGLQAEGIAEEIAGKAQGKLGQIENAIQKHATRKATA